MSATALEFNGETFCHTSYAPLQNVQPANYFQLATGMEAIIPSDFGVSNGGCLEPGLPPVLKIIVPPCDKFRFRYRSESGSHGKLRGPAKNRLKTNFPTVKLCNYEPHDGIEIRASLYTCEDDPKPHILELVGKNCTNGACIEKLSNDNTAIFRFLEIESKRKEEAVNALTTKKIELYGSMCDEEEIKKQVQEEIKLVNVNCAILCFEAFHKDDLLCGKVFSGPIKNLKSTSSDLKITRISSSSGSCRGGDDIILLCDKINKDDIDIHFYVKDENDDILWKEKGVFNPKVDVHHQVAIAFKTPSYKDNVGGTIQMELYRRSDKQSSEPRSFTYIPDDIDALRYSKKRKFNDAESVELQNTCTASSSTEFMSSSSNSSGLEASDPFLGSPSTSLSDDAQFDISQLDIAEFLKEENFPFSLVDGNNFNEQLNQFHGSIDPPATGEYDTEIHIDAAEPWSLDSYPYRNWDEESADWRSADLERGHYEQYSQAAVLPQLIIPSGEIATSGGLGIFSLLADLSSMASSNLWNATVGRVVSYIAPSPSCKSGTTTLSHKSVNQSIGEMADPAIDASQSTGNEIYEQSFIFMEDLSVKEDNKTDIKPFAPQPVGNMANPDKIANKTVFTGTNLYAGQKKASLQGNSKNIKDMNNEFVARSEIAGPAIKAPRSTNSNRSQCVLDLNIKGLSIHDDDERDIKPFVPRQVGSIKRPVKVVQVTDTDLYNQGEASDIKDINKLSKMNKSLEQFKEGVSQVMKKREKDVYLRYISRLMSVTDENGNLFLHLAVMEQSENLNLIARILKIAPQAVNEQNKFKETPIHIATKNNAWKVVYLLLSEGGNPSIIDVNGNNCFHIASKSNLVNSMKIILSPNLKHGKRIPSVDGFNYNGFTPLHLAVINNAKECMQLLLTAGADININDRTSGSSAMHLAIKQQPSLISYLLSCPDIDMINPDFNEYTIVHALCAMKGTPFPEIGKSTNLIYWAHKTLALPTEDAEESSSTDYSTETSSNSSDEEVHDQCETASTSITSCSESFQTQIIYGGEENSKSLSEECEKRLCQYLDADCGWRKLGLFVGLDEKTLNGVATLSKNSSPSKLVLKKVKMLYKNCDKNTLMNILTMADLKDASRLLKQ